MASRVLGPEQMKINMSCSFLSSLQSNKAYKRAEREVQCIVVHAMIVGLYRFYYYQDLTVIQEVLIII